MTALLHPQWRAVWQENSLYVSAYGGVGPAFRRRLVYRGAYLMHQALFSGHMTNPTLNLVPFGRWTLRDKAAGGGRFRVIQIIKNLANNLY
jgi:hypothetical protein